MDTISRILYYAFILLVLLLAVGLIGTQTPLFGDYQLRIVQSGSMEPTISTGSLVIVVPKDRYMVDEIVTFESSPGEVPTTHRIVDDRLESGELRYLTKGDANEEVDARYLDPDDIIGSVWFSLPFVGYIIDFARKPLGFVLMVAIPAGIVVIDEGLTIYREVRKKGKVKETHENTND